MCIDLYAYTVYVCIHIHVYIYICTHTHIVSSLSHGVGCRAAGDRQDNLGENVIHNIIIILQYIQLVGYFISYV